MPRFGKKSKERLKGIDTKLVNVLNELVYSNDYLDSLGLTVGALIGFTPSSEYEFNIDDKKLYRIQSKDVTIDYGCKAET